jgi:hypothetical protein
MQFSGSVVGSDTKADHPPAQYCERAPLSSSVFDCTGTARPYRECRWSAVAVQNPHGTTGRK